MLAIGLFGCDIKCCNINTSILVSLAIYFEFNLAELGEIYIYIIYILFINNKTNKNNLLLEVPSGNKFKDETRLYLATFSCIRVIRKISLVIRV